MHSRIFQISKEQNVDSITEDRYFDGYMTHADYVVQNKSVESDYEWLTSCNNGLKIETKDGVTTLTIVSKEEYFEKSFNNFKKYVKKINNYTLEEFMGNNSFDMYNLKESYDNEYGFYVDDNDEYFGLVTFDYFMRSVNNGDTYYLSSVFDYHF